MALGEGGGGVGSKFYLFFSTSKAEAVNFSLSLIASTAFKGPGSGFRNAKDFFKLFNLAKNPKLLRHKFEVFDNPGGRSDVGPRKKDRQGSIQVCSPPRKFAIL